MHQDRKSSVIEFSSSEELLHELLLDEISYVQEKEAVAASKKTTTAGSSTREGEGGRVEEGHAIGPRRFFDWMLHEYDCDSTRANSASDEFLRLQALNTYAALDMKKDAEFDRITRMAATALNSPVSWCLLVDLRRMKILSSIGLGDLEEMPRSDVYPCAHSMRLMESEVIVIPDMTKDRRFAPSPLVTGEPGIRFYASAALISPEGYRVGTLGVVDTTARPDGITPEQEQTLVDLAAMAMRLLIDRRYKLQMESKLDKAIAYTSHDIMTPLTGLQLSINMLLEEAQKASSNFQDKHKELVMTAESCVSAMTMKSQTVLAEIRKEMDRERNNKPTSTLDTAKGICDMQYMVKTLYEVMNQLPKKVPLMISLDLSAPTAVICDDLFVFRTALAFLSVACVRTTTGCIMLRISFDTDSNLVFTTEYTAPPLEESKVARVLDLSQPCMDSDLMCLRHSATLVASKGGECSYQIKDGSCQDVSVLWFRIPVSLPEGQQISVGEILPPGVSAEALIGVAKKRLNDEGERLIKVASELALAIEEDLEHRRKKALVIDDSLVIRKSLGRALEKLGYEVTLAKDGMAGLQALQMTIFDFVLCDFLMPVMDGLDCVKQYRDWEVRNRPWFRQHIIGMSAHANENDAMQGQKVGMNDFKTKPVTITYLEDLVESPIILSIVQRLVNLQPWMLKMNLVRDMMSKRERSEDDTSDFRLMDHDESHIEALPHRRTISNTLVGDTSSACLVCTNDADVDDVTGPLSLSVFQSYGWRKVVARNSDDALRLLKNRNWSAIIVDSVLHPENGTSLVSSFRQWENINRVNRQNNLFLRCASFDSEMYMTLQKGVCGVIQPPPGFDGVLGKTSQWKDFENLLEQETDEHGTPLMKIITRYHPNHASFTRF